MASWPTGMRSFGCPPIHHRSGLQRFCLRQQLLLASTVSDYNGRPMIYRRSSVTIFGQFRCGKWGPGRDKRKDGSATFAMRSSAKSKATISSSQPQTAFTHEELESFLLSMQGSICTAAAEADGIGKRFSEDRWQRGEDPHDGYGITRVMEDGDLLEKGAVNVSVVRGQLSESRAKVMSARGRNVCRGAPYFAAALSVVFHPCSPYVPTFRSDVRYFEVEGGGGWFGGGADLTPSYLFEDDARLFHKFYKAICDESDPTHSLYPRLKEACDAYFYIPARKEHRGIGGIFFDDLDSLPGISTPYEEGGQKNTFEFVKAVAAGFMPSYLPLAQRRRKMKFGEPQRQWQLLRRGRYLEFNLLYDRGVKFGLDGGRIESIMVSAPPLIAWRYNIVPDVHSPEGELLEVLKQPRQWH